MAALPDKSARPVMCPVKAGMFSREQTCRGRSQNPVVWIAEETSAGVRDTKRLMISREVSQASIVENLSPGPAVPHRSAEIKFTIDSSLDGAGFEPSVPLVRPIPESFVRMVSRDACAPVKCAGAVPILTIEWLDGDRYHARTLYRNHARRE